jgi:hypothetical protein
MNDFGFYFRFGWDHIMTPDALDHMLFIAALSAIYMLRDWKQVIILVTAFTVGHSITLALTSLNLISFPTEWVEFLVPITIIITAVFNLFQKNFTPRSIRLNYFLALFFGLVHGMAFASLLTMILSTDQSFALAMISFSLGLELGQVIVVIFILLLAQLFIGVLGKRRKEWVIFISAAVFALALQMAIERIPGRGNDQEAIQQTTGADHLVLNTNCILLNEQ